MAEPSQAVSKLPRRTQHALHPADAAAPPATLAGGAPRGGRGGAALILVLPCFDFQATTSTNWILESQNINELKSEINSLKGLLLNR